MNQRPAAVIVLAAGQGTRMKSARPKILHDLAGRTLLGHAITAAQQLDPQELVVVVRHQRDRVCEHLAGIAPAALVADQDEIPGTGRAVQCGLQALEEQAPGISGPIVVTSGDVPLLSGQTLAEMLAAHAQSGSVATVLTTVLADPTGYGRIVHEDGELARIVEHRDATEVERAIGEINGGVYVFEADFLRGALAELDQDNDQGEVYLTDVVAAAAAQSLSRISFPVADPWQVAGCNDRVQLAELATELNRRLCEKWMRAGVSIVDPAGTWIDVDVALGQDCTVYPGCRLEGATTIGDNCLIGPDTRIRDTEVGSGCELIRVEADTVRLGNAVQAGPWVSLRPGCDIADDVRIGAFTELRNIKLTAGSEIPPHSFRAGNTAGAGAWEGDRESEQLPSKNVTGRTPERDA